MQVPGTSCRGVRRRHAWVQRDRLRGASPRGESLRAWLLRASLALLLAAWTIASPAAEFIERFHAVVDVRPDGDLEVTETIAVHAEGRQIRRGIYRDFPMTFTDAQGDVHRVEFELLEVTRNARPEPHFTRANAQGVRIYAGSEDHLLPTGLHTYTFRYRTARQIRFFPEHVELNWNVTGNEWAFPIHSARAVVRLPGNVAPVRWIGFTGRFGERGSDYSARLRDDGALEIATTRTLAPGEGVTVVAEIPAGAVSAPTRAEELRYALLDHRRAWLAGLGLLGVFAFYLYAWRAVGRDPQKGTIIPLFHPPEGISPALAAYVRQWGWSGGWREFTATAVSLAVRGLVVFDDSDGTLTLKRATQADPKVPGPAGPNERDTLGPGERSLLGWIDRNAGTARIDRSNGTSLSNAFQAFKTAIEKENRNRFFRRNLGWVLVGLGLTAASIAVVFAFGHLSEAEVGVLVGTGFAIVFLGVFVGVFVVRTVRSLLSGRRLRTIVGALIHIAVVLYIGGIGASMFVTAALESDAFRRSLFDGLRANAFPLALVGGMALLNAVFGYLLRAPTAAGRGVMDRIEGLALYLRTAESARMNLVGAPELTTEHFERLLPYAIALELEKPWSAAFEAAFARAHPGEEVRESYRPAWNGGSDWSGRSFGSAVAATVSSAEGAFASATPPPSSSSSGFSSGGGGGGSGGGGGGGGGGGW